MSGLLAQGTQYLKFFESADRLMYANKFDDALLTLDSAFLLSNSLQDEIGKQRIFNRVGFILSRLDQFDSAYQLHQQVMEFALKRNLVDLEHETYFYLGVTKNMLGDIADAESYQLKSLKYFEAQPIPNTEIAGRIYSNLAYNKLTAGDLDSAFKLLHKSLVLLNDPKLIFNQATNYYLLAGIYYDQGNYADAEKTILKALDFYDRGNIKINLTFLYIRYIRILTALNKSNEIKLTLEKLSALTNENFRTMELESTYDFLMSYYESNQDYRSALFYSRKVMEVRDSINLTDKVNAITRIENDIRFQMEQERMRLLEDQLESQQQSNRLQRLYIFLAVLVSIYLGGFVIVFRRLVNQKTKSQELLISKNKELQNKTLHVEMAQNRLVQSEKMALLGRLSAGIAHELNNPIGAIKSNIKLITDIQQHEFEDWRDLTSLLSLDEIQLLSQFLHDICMVRSHSMIVYSDEKKIQIEIEKRLKDEGVYSVELFDFLVEIKFTEPVKPYLILLNHPAKRQIFDFILLVIDRVQAAHTVKDALERISKILSSFKTYSFKRGWEEFVSFNLFQNIETIILLHQNILKGVKVVKDIDRDITIEGIPDELSQVWSNLISNAAYAMNFSGMIAITAMQVGNSEVCITFSDTGGGIKVAPNKDIFEPFFTTKPEGEGSGLGLNICKQIIEKHRGRIIWRNTDVGAEFMINLPIKASQDILS